MHRIAALVAGALLLLVCGPARAAAPAAVATVDGTTLLVRADAHGRACLTLQAEDGSTTGLECSAPPRSPYQPQTLGQTPEGPLALLVDDRVAAVDLAGARTATAAVDGAEARVALVRRGGPDDLLRFYAADGSLVGAAGDEDGPELGGPAGRLLFRGGGATIRGRRSAVLQPDPLQPDFTSPATCLSVLGDDGSGTCDRVVDLEVAPHVEPACAPGRGLLWALLPARVDRVRITFGDGRTRSVPARPLPPDVGPGRLLALSLPRGRAVRSVAALDTSGRRVARRRLAAAPTGGRCAARQGGSALSTLSAGFSGPPPRPAAALRPVAEAAGRALRAADGPDRLLCTRVVPGPPVACEVPPVDAGTSGLQRAGRTVAGAVAADVAEVRMRLDDGRTVRAASVADPGYGGIFAGRVRFVAVAVPAGRHVRRATARDAAGRSLGAVAVQEPLRARTSRRRLGGGLVRTRTVYTQGGRRTSQTCVRARGALAGLARVGVCGGDGLAALVSVACAPRRTVALGALPRGATGVRLRLSGGRTVPARIRAVRGAGRLWSGVLGRREALAGVVFTGRLRATRARPEPARRLVLGLPPAARQCGYDAVVG